MNETLVDRVREAIEILGPIESATLALEMKEDPKRVRNAITQLRMKGEVFKVMQDGKNLWNFSLEPIPVKERRAKERRTVPKAKEIPETMTKEEIAEAFLELICNLKENNRALKEHVQALEDELMTERKSYQERIAILVEENNKKNSVNVQNILSQEICKVE